MLPVLAGTSSRIQRTIYADDTSIGRDMKPENFLMGCKERSAYHAHHASVSPCLSTAHAALPPCPPAALSPRLHLLSFYPAPVLSRTRPGAFVFSFQSSVTRPLQLTLSLPTTHHVFLSLSLSYPPPSRANQVFLVDMGMSGWWVDRAHPDSPHVPLRKLPP